MKISSAINNFIIHMPLTHKNTIKAGDVTLYLDSSYNKHEHRIPKGKVVATPKNIKTNVEVGDYIYIHHNIVRSETKSIGDDLYIVDARPENPLCYAVEGDNKPFKPLYDFVFVKPEPIERVSEKSGLTFIQKEESLAIRYGYIHSISDNALKILGVDNSVIGKRINFRRFRNVALDVNGENLFRMRAKDINIIYHG